MNLHIVRAFIALKQFAIDYKLLAEQIAVGENETNQKFSSVFKALNLLLEKHADKEDWEQRKRVGFSQLYFVKKKIQ